MRRKGQRVEDFLKHKKIEKSSGMLPLSLCFMALMFIFGYIGPEQVTHDAQRREGGGATHPRLNMEMH